MFFFFFNVKASFSSLQWVVLLPQSGVRSGTLLIPSALSAPSQCVFTLSVHKLYYCGWFVPLASLRGGEWHASLLLLCTSILSDWRKAPVAPRRWRPARCVPPPSAVFTRLLTGMFFIVVCCSEISQTGSPESGFSSPPLCFLTSRLRPLAPSPSYPSGSCWYSSCFSNFHCKHSTDLSSYTMSIIHIFCPKRVVNQRWSSSWRFTALLVSELCQSALFLSTSSRC